MTAPPVGDKREDDGAGEEDGAAVVCVSSESFLEKRGRDGEDRKHLPVFFCVECCCKDLAAPLVRRGKSSRGCLHESYFLSADGCESCVENRPTDVWVLQRAACGTGRDWFRA